MTIENGGKSEIKIQYTDLENTKSKILNNFERINTSEFWKNKFPDPTHNAEIIYIDGNGDVILDNLKTPKTFFKKKNDIWYNFEFENKNSPSMWIIQDTEDGENHKMWINAETNNLSQAIEKFKQENKMKQEIEQLIEKYNNLLVATETEIVKFKEELLEIVDKQFE